jgi:hypothetical protein
MSGVERGKARSSDSELSIVGTSRLGRFTTTLLLEDSRGERQIWSSRRNRKGLDTEPAHLVARSRPRHVFPIKPGSLTWWIAVLFMIGSTLFAVGSGSAVFGTTLPASSGMVFFVGSLFFTSAGYLQFLEVVNEPDALTKLRPSISLWRWEPHKIGWWAVLVQLIGTLLFNMNTFEAMRTLSPIDQDGLVWAPDAIGSICFLVASYLAYAEVGTRWMGWQPRNISWWIVVINLLGSVAFGASAVASLVVVQSDKLLSPYGSNLWTFVGALCFFVGAYLLLPEMTSHSARQGS